MVTVCVTLILQVAPAFLGTKAQSAAFAARPTTHLSQGMIPLPITPGFQAYGTSVQLDRAADVLDRGSRTCVPIAGDALTTCPGGSLPAAQFHLY